MIYVLANDAQLARRWAEDRRIPAGAWCFATADKLKAHPSGEHAGETLVMLEGAEKSPYYATILELARDRGIETSAAQMGPRDYPDLLLWGIFAWRDEFYAAWAMSCLMVAERAAKSAAVRVRPLGLSL